jgi:hypothetical protein
MLQIRSVRGARVRPADDAIPGIGPERLDAHEAWKHAARELDRAHSHGRGHQHPECGTQGQRVSLACASPTVTARAPQRRWRASRNGRRVHFASPVTMRSANARSRRHSAALRARATPPEARRAGCVLTGQSVAARQVRSASPIDLRAGRVRSNDASRRGLHPSSPDTDQRPEIPAAKASMVRKARRVLREPLPAGVRYSTRADRETEDLRSLGASPYSSLAPKVATSWSLHPCVRCVSR